MTGRIEPATDTVIELIHRHPGVRSLEEHHPLAGPRAEHSGDIAGQGRGNRRILLPLRMVALEPLELVDDELRLERERGLGPERAVVVKDGDPRRRLEEVGGAGRRHPLEKREDRGAGRAVVPRREWLRRRRLRHEDNADHEQGENAPHAPRTHDRSLL